MTPCNPKLHNWPDSNESSALARTFPIKEAVRRDFRWEAFNLVNRVQFGPTPVPRCRVTTSATSSRKAINCGGCGWH
jgi:hypothetical protein